MTDRPDIPRSPFEDEQGPRLLLNGVWLRPREIQLEEEAGGCGCLIALTLIGALVCLAAILGSGCTPRYTVIPADREVVPVKALRAGEQRTENGERIAPAGRRIYVEAEEGATGWYVPDATMIELLEAE